MIFAEDLNLKAMSRGMLCKHTLDAGWGQLISILKWVCWKRDVYFAVVNPIGHHRLVHSAKLSLGRKTERIHQCNKCGYQTDRDVAAAQVVAQRGCVAVGHTVESASWVKSSPEERIPAFTPEVSND